MEVLADHPLAKRSHFVPNTIEQSYDEADDTRNLRTMDYVEKNAIIEALVGTRGNVVSAARLLGLGQATVYRKIKRYDLVLAEFRRDDDADCGEPPAGRRRA